MHIIVNDNIVIDELTEQGKQGGIDVILNKLKKHKNVRSLNFINGDITCEVFLSNILSHNEKLKNFVISAEILDIKLIEALSTSLKNNKALKSLTIDVDYMDQQSVLTLYTALKQNTTLETLELKIKERKESLSLYLFADPQLFIRHLILTENRLNNDDIEKLSFLLSQNSNLQKLDLMFNQFDDTDINYLINIIEKNSAFEICKNNNEPQGLVEKINKLEMIVNGFQSNLMNLTNFINLLNSQQSSTQKNICKEAVENKKDLKLRNKKDLKLRRYSL